MISSIYKRFAVLFFVFSLVILSSLFLLSKDGFQSDVLRDQIVTPGLTTSNLEATPQEPVIQLASLTLSVDDNQDPILERPIITSTETESLLIQANSLVELKEFDKAIWVLNTIQDADKNDYAVQFLKARILSWSGRHYEADQKFRALTEQYPQNSDILVSYGYLKLYQKKHSQAEQLFDQVLKMHPDYQDARAGLNIALSAKKL